jgi:hypothetical protein
MVEQLVVARGRRFVGCMFSTFTAFVHRLRGYYSTRDHYPGYKEVSYRQVTTMLPCMRKGQCADTRHLSGRFHLREYPVGWRDIDWDLEHNRTFGYRKNLGRGHGVLLLAQLLVLPNEFSRFRINCC